MGFNTTVLVLNDALTEIENDPEFGKKLVAGIRKLGSTGGIHPGPVNVPVGNHANPVTVIETHHADWNGTDCRWRQQCNGVLHNLRV